MWTRREFPCFDAVESAVDCLCRATVLLQNLAEYGGDETLDSCLRRLRGLAAAAHRNWRELNERLARTFITAVDREDVSALVRELVELTAALSHTAALWQSGSLDHAVAVEWTARLATGSNLVRELAAQLPLLWRDNTLSDLAEALYALRREGDAQFERQVRRLRGAPLATLSQLHACCTDLARLADTAEWLALKNT